MRGFGLKINKKTLLKMVIGMGAVKLAPTILNKVAPSLNNGYTGNLIAGAIGVGVGIVMKDEVVQTVAAATALTEIVNDIAIEPMMASLLPAPTGTTGSNLRRLANYTTLKDFPRRVAVNNNYHNIYN